MKFGQCPCGRAHLLAVKRPWWAKLLFPNRKRYKCLKCGMDQLQSRY